MIHVPEYKEPQHSRQSESYLTPKKLYLPLIQHTGKPSRLCVSEGSTVEEGSVLAERDGLISAALHAPKNGKIDRITSFPHPLCGRAQTICMTCAPSARSYSLRYNALAQSGEELIERLQHSGIVGMGGASFPTHVKAAPPKPITTLILNGCECEPFLSADYRLMWERAEEILKGTEVLCRLLKPRKVILAVESHTQPVCEHIRSVAANGSIRLPDFELRILPSRYPQGGEKQLIRALTGREVPPKNLPLDVGCMVQNVATCVAVYEAVYLSKPLIERLVCFCGDAVKEPKNVWVKIGTTLQELVEEKVIELEDSLRKIVCGGPMMGTALDGLHYPILKGTGGFLFLSESFLRDEESPCIRCGRCVDACPMNLAPLEYVKRITRGEYGTLSDYYIEDCIECGACTYVCPARIPLVHYIRLGKQRLRAQTPLKK
ncbi:MAG: electron transport complex subunit RsxC [Candidatus Omnitrophica bacterium]|nr:electron transport complex subunit RsxC [Candidatus Omnitrophota bacterium]